MDALVLTLRRYHHLWWIWTLTWHHGEERITIATGAELSKKRVDAAVDTWTSIWARRYRNTGSGR